MNDSTSTPGKLLQAEAEDMVRKDRYRELPDADIRRTSSKDITRSLSDKAKKGDDLNAKETQMLIRK